ncbi:MAG: MBL fold metallo-hydrolase [Coriobacteriales bacterium]|nr:MBL fold metallo-hydrolase [Coriobacteriales bacterium]
MDTLPKIEHLVVGPIQTNCYIIETESGVIVVDPGDEPQTIKQALGERVVIHILITHAHFDHVGALDDLIQTYNCPWTLGKKDISLLETLSRDAQMFGLSRKLKVQPTQTVSDNDSVQIGGLTFAVIECPGHTPGSVTYYNKDNNWAFTGDTLFATSCGRCDLPGGDPRAIQESLVKLCKLPGDTLILCGHGPVTTLEWCKKYNPYCS